MDPIAHTLVGANLAQTGLRTRTALGTTTLLIGANLPDIDAVAYFWGGETAVWFRRGLTHGILAWVALPLLLTACILLWKSLMRHRWAYLERVSGRQVLLLSAIAVATHPLLDFLNVYGIRLLEPFSDRWYYGDTLFIIDPWLWMVLTAGVWLGGKRMKYAALALIVAATYAAAMVISNIAVRAQVARWAPSETVIVDDLMIAPIAVTPFERWVVVEDSLGYWVGMYTWLPAPDLELIRLPYPKLTAELAVKVAARDRRGEQFLSWARFPFYRREVIAERRTLLIGDARYTVDPEAGWATTRVTVDVVAR